MLLVTAADTLHAAAAYAREHAGTSVWEGPIMPTRDERAKRRAAVEKVAGDIDALAETSLRERVSYMTFDELLGALRNLGFWIDGQLVSAVSFAMHRDEQAEPLLSSRKA